MKPDEVIPMWVLSQGRDANQIDEYERQALISELCSSGLLNLDVRRIDSLDTSVHFTVLGGFALTDGVTVLLAEPQQAGKSAKFAAMFPHYIFMQDQRGDGSPLGRRLHRLLPTGEFEVCNPRSAT